MTRAAAFTQDDLVRALKSCAKADLPVARIELEPGGKIVILARAPGVTGEEAQGNEWDQVLPRTQAA